MSLSFRNWFWCLIVFSCSTIVSKAENRKYVLGTTIDLAGGGTNQFGSGGQVLNQSFFSFYGTYPSISLKSTASHSLLDASYSYGLMRGNTAQNLNEQSHA